MYDIFLEWGGDLAVGNGGDLAVSTENGTTSQRICRRLLTNAGDYIWNLDYGGGLGQFVGTSANSGVIEAIVREQLALEAAVPTIPAPQISVQIADATNGYFVATITYADPSTLAPVQLNVSSG